jgi:hypothetical protein
MAVSETTTTAPAGATGTRPSDGTTEQTYEVANLLYFFWLPSGKDEFGFQAYDDAPLRPTTFYREAFERTIAQHLQAQEQRLRSNRASLSGLTWRGSLAPQDAELGLRKIEYSFEYEPDRRHLPATIAAGPFTGTAIIMSNGLYLWAFEIRYERGADDHELRQSLDKFLKEDFVQHHVHRLFGFGWTNADLDRRHEDYDGVLTYYQLDLLFNCVFDANAHPHLFLFGDQEVRNRPREEEMYSIGAIVRSLSISCFKKDYAPLWDLRKNYSFRAVHGEERHPYIDTDVRLSVDGTVANGEREKLLSRVSLAAMEQFLRIAVPFGVTHYKAGLDHCRTELVSHNLLARRNQASSELRRPSLRGASSSPGEIEAYQAVIAAKVPSLEFVHGLVAGLSEVSAPLLAPREFEASNSWIEWSFGKSTFKEALDGFERYIHVITTELAFIQSGLLAAHNDEVLSELADARKLAEMETEDTHRSVTIEGGEWDNLSFRLAEFAIFLGLVEVYSNIGVWLSQSLFSGGLLPRSTPTLYKVLGLVHWVPVLIAGVALFMYLRRRQTAPRAVVEAAQKKQKPESHIFDHAFTREVVNHTDRTIGVVDDLKRGMLDLEDPKRVTRPVAFSSFREVPDGGVERIKYSLESSPNANGVYYLLHVEIDRRKVLGRHRSGEAERAELLRNVRLVARVPRNHEIDVETAVRPVIGGCVRDLILNDRTEAEKRTFFKNQFGWDWP